MGVHERLSNIRDGARRCQAASDPISIIWNAHDNYQRQPVGLAVQVLSHAIEQRRSFRVFVDVDDTAEEDAVGCLIDGIAQLTFEAD